MSASGESLIDPGRPLCISGHDTHNLTGYGLPASFAAFFSAFRFSFSAFFSAFRRCFSAFRSALLMCLAPSPFISLPVEGAAAGAGADGAEDIGTAGGIEGAGSCANVAMPNAKARTIVES